MVAPSSFGSDKIHTWKYYSDPSAGDTKGWHGSDPVDRYICDDKVTLGNLWLAPLGESNVDRGFWRKFLPSAVETNILFTKIFPSLQWFQIYTEHLNMWHQLTMLPKLSIMS